MDFEFDPNKSSANKTKHGIDLNRAQALWDDPNRLIVPARNLVEPRYLLIAELGGRYWSAIYTIRNRNIRIISVRRARDNEKKAYES